MEAISRRRDTMRGKSMTLGGDAGGTGRNARAGVVWGSVALVMIRLMARVKVGARVRTLLRPAFSNMRYS